jgi:peptidoglycan/xylan/chitin deacetylase (PgdA/CDA1 family)
MPLRENDEIPDLERESLLKGGGKPTGRIRVPILYYHRVAEDIQPGQGVTPMVFRTQIEYLRRRKYQSVGFEDLADFFRSGRPLPDKATIITFDDGYLDTFTQAYPILKTAGFTATIFMVSGHIGGWSDWEGGQTHRAPLMNREQILTMASQGFQFGGHTRNHKKLVSIGLGEAEKEISSGKKDLEALLQKPVLSFAYPYGDFNEQIIELVKICGFKAARTVHTGNTHGVEDLLRLSCVKINGNTPAWKFKYYLTGLYHWDIQWQEWKKARRTRGK